MEFVLNCTAGEISGRQGEEFIHRWLRLRLATRQWAWQAGQMFTKPGRCQACPFSTSAPY